MAERTPFVLAEHIVDCIYWVWRAAEPPRPRRDARLSAGAYDQQITEWLTECRYRDAQIALLLAGSWWPEHPVYTQGLLTYVALAPASPYTIAEHDPAMVFVGGTYFAPDAEPDGPDRYIKVWRYVPGPWVAHLMTLSARALPIYRQRASLRTAWEKSTTDA
jgi:hypothetical protein